MSGEALEPALGSWHLSQGCLTERMGDTCEWGTQAANLLIQGRAAGSGPLREFVSSEIVVTSTTKATNKP